MTKQSPQPNREKIGKNTKIILLQKFIGNRTSTEGFCHAWNGSYTTLRIRPNCKHYPYKKLALEFGNSLY